MLHRIVAVLLIGLSLSACHTIRFDISDEPVTNVVRERKSFFLFGLVPGDLEVDVRERCPGGAAAIEEEFSFTDGLFTFLFLGIWELKSSWYHCVGGEPV